METTGHKAPAAIVNTALACWNKSTSGLRWIRLQISIVLWSCCVASGLTEYDAGTMTNNRQEALLGLNVLVIRDSRSSVLVIGEQEREKLVAMSDTWRDGKLYLMLLYSAVVIKQTGVKPASWEVITGPLTYTHIHTLTHMHALVNTPHVVQVMELIIWKNVISVCFATWQHDNAKKVNKFICVYTNQFITYKNCVSFSSFPVQLHAAVSSSWKMQKEFIVKNNVWLHQKGNLCKIPWLLTYS